MLADPQNRLVADTLEGEWNEKLQAVAAAREKQERLKEHNRLLIDEAVHKRLVAMTTDFAKLWSDPATANRDRKRLLAYIIEDATLIKLPAEGMTKIHVHFKGGKTETLTAVNPKSSGDQVRTPSEIVKIVDTLLEGHPYSEIATLLNQRGFRPGGTARPGHACDHFDAARVAYLVHRYGLLPRFDRLRRRGMLTRKEAAKRLGMHEATLASWAKYGIVIKHNYNGHACLFEIPESNLPSKHCSRWDRLANRAANIQRSKSSHRTTGDVL